MVSATRSPDVLRSHRGFLGALLLCGVCDATVVALTSPQGFLGALLLCGVCDLTGQQIIAGMEVSRSSSALWCLRLPVQP